MAKNLKIVGGGAGTLFITLLTLIKFFNNSAIYIISLCLTFLICIFCFLTSMIVEYQENKFDEKIEEIKENKKGLKEQIRTYEKENAGLINENISLKNELEYSKIINMIFMEKSDEKTRKTVMDTAEIKKIGNEGVNKNEQQ